MTAPDPHPLTEAVETERRSEVLSLRLTASEKQRLAARAERQQQLANGRPAQSLSDWARDRLLREVDAPLVFPSQNITVSIQPAAAATDDVIRSLRRALAAAERMARR